MLHLEAVLAQWLRHWTSDRKVQIPSLSSCHCWALDVNPQLLSGINFFFFFLKDRCSGQVTNDITGELEQKKKNKTAATKAFSGQDWTKVK